MLLMMGGGERAGSGVDKIRSGWKSQHWRSPMVAERQQPDRVSWFLPMLSLVPAETLEKLRERFGVPTIASMPGLELQALATLELEGLVTNRRMQELVDEHSTEITKRLQALCAEGFLESDNRRRWTTYRFKEWIPSLFDGHGTAVVEPHKEPDSGHKGADSTHKEPDSGHKEADSGHKDVDSGHKKADSPHKDVDTDHFEHDLAALRQIAARVADAERSSPDAIRAVIEELCGRRYLTSAEIGSLLKRNPEGVRKRFLNPMVKEGVLRLRFAQSASRPDQAYTSALEGARE